MSEVIVFKEGGYRYIKSAFQFSSGVAAEAGFELERVRWIDPLPLADGFAAVEGYLKEIGRPTTAVAACELRSAVPFTPQGFHDFNREYVKTLARWGIYRDEINPVARTNVCPEFGKPGQPVLYAFSYTVPARNPKRRTFVLSGGADVRTGAGSYAERVVRYNETTPDAMREKWRHVFAEMETRLALLGFGWKDAANTQAFTVHEIGGLIGRELAARGAAAGGVCWHFTRPPVQGLEVEMDVRTAAREIVR